MNLDIRSKLCEDKHYAIKGSISSFCIICNFNYSKFSIVFLKQKNY